MTDNNKLNEAFRELEYEEEATIKYREAFPKDYQFPVTRNDVLEEVAVEMERFTFAFGVDTVHSFTAFVRGMKQWD